MNEQCIALIKRGHIFLADKEWDKAYEYSDRALDMDPENGDAYLLRLLSEMEISSMDDLTVSPIPLPECDSYVKALRFANGELKRKLLDLEAAVQKKLNTEELERKYNAAIRAMESARTETDVQNAIDMFERISAFRDVDSKVQECVDKIEAITQRREKLRQEEEKQNKIVKKRNLQFVAAVLIMISVVIGVRIWHNMKREGIIEDNFRLRQFSRSSTIDEERYDFDADGNVTVTTIEGYKVGYYANGDFYFYPDDEKTKIETYEASEVDVEVDFVGNAYITIGLKEFKIKLTPYDSPISISRGTYTYE